MTRAQVEQLLLRKAIPDPVKAARITELLEEIGADIIARTGTPHRSGGASDGHAQD